MNRTGPRRAAIALIVLSLGGGGRAAFAQAAPKIKAGSDVEVDPINCWWRTDKTAVAVGERFMLTLTCGIVETDRNKVVVDPNQLDASALSLAPFEIAAATRHEDVLSPPWRY